MKINIIIFIPRDENKSVFIEKKLELSVSELFLVILNNSAVLNVMVALHYILLMKIVRQDTSENT